MTGRGESERARRLGRAVPNGALGTRLRATGGQPYGSLGVMATAHDGAPLLRLSDPSDAGNPKVEDRASLLLGGSDRLRRARAAPARRTARLAFDALIGDAEAPRAGPIGLARRACDRLAGTC